MFAEPELDRVAHAVDGSIEVHPAAANLDVGLVHMPLAAHRSLASIEALQQQRREVDDPAVDRRMVDADTALCHHFFQIPQAQAIGRYQRTHSRITDRSKLRPLNMMTSPETEMPSCRQPITETFATDPGAPVAGS
jgi:hypothetical protein